LLFLFVRVELPLFCLSAPLCCPGFSIFLFCIYCFHLVLHHLHITRDIIDVVHVQCIPLTSLPLKFCVSIWTIGFGVLQGLIYFGFFLKCFEVISVEACDADGIFCSFWASAVFRFRASCQSSDQHSTHSNRAQYYWSVCLSLLEFCWQRNQI
jgi:hypothetical protein